VPLVGELSPALVPLYMRYATVLLSQAQVRDSSPELSPRRGT
jgi:hypothetical protein